MFKTEDGRRKTEDGRRNTEDGRRNTARLDIAIDLAVREMLDVEPAADLRARVLSRIDALPTDRAASAFPANAVASAFPANAVASAFRRKTLWVGVPLAAAAILVLAILLPPKTQRTIVNPVATVATKQPVPQSQPVVPSIKTPTPAVPTRVSVAWARSTPTPATRGTENGLVVAAVVPGDDASVIDPLTPILPIVVAGTHPTDIAPKDIAISAMAPIAPLQIVSLSPPERRN